MSTNPLDTPGGDMNDAEFLRSIAHTCEIGDPVDFPHVVRLREIADRVEQRRCPDGGACHHVCDPDTCFRVATCEPLSGVFDRDEWPRRIALEFK